MNDGDDHCPLTETSVFCPTGTKLMEPLPFRRNAQSKRKLSIRKMFVSANTTFFNSENNTFPNSPPPNDSASVSIDVSLILNSGFCATPFKSVTPITILALPAL